MNAYRNLIAQLLPCILLAAVSATSPALAQSAAGYNIDVYVHDGPTPEPNALVRVINLDIPDTLTMYTGADGHAIWSSLTAVGSELPQAPSIRHIFPNPMGAAGGTVEVVGAEKSDVDTKLALFDLRGRRVQDLEAGVNRFGRSLAAGTYFVKDMNTGDVARFVSMGKTSRLTIKQVASDYDATSVAAKSVLNVDVEVDTGTRMLVEENVLLSPPPEENYVDADFYQGSPSELSLAFKVREIDGSNQQNVGSVYGMNASGVVVSASADADSVYRLVIPINSPDEIVRVWPLGMEDLSHNYVVLHPDSVGVRALIGQLDPEGVVAQGTDLVYSPRDTARLRANDPNLESDFLLLDYVRQELMDNEDFRKGLGDCDKRYDDREKVYLAANIAPGYEDPVPAYAFAKLADAEFKLQDVFENTPDGRPLIRTVSTDTVYTAPTNFENAASRVMIPSGWPTNQRYDFNQDGFQDFHAATIPVDTPIGTMLAENAGEVVNDVGGTASYTHENGEFTDLFKVMAATWAKFQLGTNFYRIDF